MLTNNSNKHYHIPQAKQELLFSRLYLHTYCSHFYVLKSLSLVHTVTTNCFLLKALLCIYSCFRHHLPCKLKNMLIKSPKTVLKIILHAGLHDPVTLGYKWFYQSRFCNWSPSPIRSFDSIAQLRQLCQSSKQPGGSFHQPVSTSVYCMNFSCNFIK